MDFNVPMAEGVITDDSRIRASLPTLNYLVGHGAKVIVVSHLGRPKGWDLTATLAPVAKRLSEMVSFPVEFVSESLMDGVPEAVKNLQNGCAVMLENIRFYPEETTNDLGFSQKLAALADVFVLDAFGTAHRAHASTEGIAHQIEGVAGFLVEKELTFLGGAISDPKRPMVVIVGGAKISSKMGLLKHLLGKADVLVVGGAMTFTLLKAKGLEVGLSMCEDALVDEAKRFLQAAESSSTQLVLAEDERVVTMFDQPHTLDIVPIDQIRPDQMGVDIGPLTEAAIKKVIQNAGTVVWNGPLGAFEVPEYSSGTFQIAHAIADSTAISIIGGGDSGAAIAKAGLTDRMTHVSTGGGASLEFLEGHVLPGIAALRDKV